MGLFGDPADPETNALVVQMLKLPETTQILEHLARQQQKQQEMQEQMMAMQQQQMELQAAPKQSFDPEAETMKAELEQAKMAGKSELELQKLREQSLQKREDYAAQKLADLQAQMALQAVTPQQQQEKPRPSNKKQ